MTNIPSEIATPLPVGPMTTSWLESNLTSEVNKKQWLDEGYVVFRGAFSENQINEYNNIVALARTGVDDGKDEFSFGDRIGQLHQKYPELMEIAANRDLLMFLKWALDDEPVLFGSLNFDKGSQQEAHIDAIFFWPEPSYSMAGCWIALEDVNQDAGPLFYLPKSHKWPFLFSENLASYKKEFGDLRNEAGLLSEGDPRRAEIVQKLGSEWIRKLNELAANFETEPVTLDLKAGDIVFWHSLLAHGGSKTLNPALSRKSVVFHYIGSKTDLYTYEQFMLYERSELSSLGAQPKAGAVFSDRLNYMKYDYYVTYVNGEQLIHKL